MKNAWLSAGGRNTPVFNSILYQELFNAQTLDWGMLLVCLLVAVVIGAVVAAVYRFSAARPSRTFLTALVMIPPIVTAIVPLTNGNLGFGLAIAGVFSLVRFRSLPGNARDLAVTFLAAAVGMLCGTGLVTLAGVVALLECAILFFLSRRSREEGTARDRELRVTIPETLDYTGVFEDLFEKYTESCRLNRVRTTNMGALFELRFLLRLQEDVSEKAFLDEIRVRNGNLPVLLAEAPPEENQEL